MRTDAGKCATIAFMCLKIPVLIKIPGMTVVENGRIVKENERNAYLETASEELNRVAQLSLPELKRLVRCTRWGSAQAGRAGKRQSTFVLNVTNAFDRTRSRTFPHGFDPTKHTVKVSPDHGNRMARAVLAWFLIKTWRLASEVDTGFPSIVEGRIRDPIAGVSSVLV
mmetsp:Transcript_54249/g.131625  ORF Transcript_54249/g.131625 Transcript_54249/m.131625 type:complete len:168 (-) Transcript_54249:1634-2137(-)